MGDPPERRPRRRRRAHGRQPLRAVDDRLAAGHVALRARADPAGRHAAHVPDLRRRWSALVAALALPRRQLLVPLAIGALLLRPAGHHEAGRRRARARGARDRAPVRARDRAARRRAPAGAQRGPGVPLHLAARHRAHRQRVGRLPLHARSPCSAARRARWPSSATAPARRCAPTGSCSRGTRDRRRGDRRRADRAGPALVRPARPARACACTPTTRGRSCAGPSGAGRRSWSTPTASPTSPST